MLSREALKREGIDTAVVLGAAGAMGMLHGRAGEMKKIGPAPIDLAVGIGSAALGVSGALGAEGSHQAFNVTRGTLAYFTGSIFAQVGQKMRKKAGELTGAATSRTVTKGVDAVPAMPPSNRNMPGEVSASEISSMTPAEIVRRVTGRVAA